MNSQEEANTYAAIDLGSNSFHMLVARREHGELRVIDRIKEMVRLGGGLDRDGNLDLETRERALACLARFGQRLRGIPADNMRAVGTQTFRRLRNANAFLVVAETGLGCSIDIIAGREEARLIYLGVSQGVSGHEERRLVIDIGGGSTEFVIGEGLTPLEMESVQYGCVSLTRRFFPKGKITVRRWNKAVDHVMADLQELRMRYLQLGWTTAVGSSGTILAVTEICRQLGLVERDLDRSALRRLRDRLLQFRKLEEVQFPGLTEQRQPVIAGGLVMLFACFEMLGLEQLRASPYALREGLLYDLLGRMENRDPRDTTVQAFKARYSVDLAQVERVRIVVERAFRHIATDAGLRHVHLQLLNWATDLHETGLSISHSHYQRHSGYLVSQSDMAGFTTHEQQFLAALVAYHRRPVPRNFARPLPSRMHNPLLYCLLCLRLGCIFARSRDTSALPDFELEHVPHGLELRLPVSWLEAHPLTRTDLETEIQEMRSLGLELRLAANA